MIMKTIKIIFLLIGLTTLSDCLYGQEKNETDTFKKDFDNVADVFENNIKSYLLKFAEMQFNPKDSLKTKEAIKAQIHLFEQKVKELRVESYKELLKDKGERKTKDYILGYFSFLYSSQFPGLDYVYFEKCKNQVIILIKNEGQKKI